ncbi:hypothetical protein F441_09198 [Phytophthora nicotianae CJ01A1]|uniref:BD-FAE-like domain-containing protein n=5 Tax=Phytophthora nicotianae TaxID=4792 RepID=W2Q5I9_PHYN3|nr:hypothetical protein PPTG_12197 [Phytophthora nicotianae INRA-310]ETK86310.1 hypothetical protein L915_09061 [Phytophthora nicotianae]ETO75050.1 hypothetical protein F444_09322 [Phytophthora nicotianae P1976]ETP16181.1 hypothetical protein F441_09198 [Phytophthora nicotianae CJ01A1]ETP44235.1 hypothetical protein F442_09164 [Phytophthora nicotianae P10297]KUF84065.1 Isoprenylcysteine alpha-carbonyl methylesterase ICME [Phytophthora nicotianae]
MATGKRSEAPSEAVQVQQKHPQQQLDGVMGVDDTVVAEPQEPLLPMHSYKQMADGDQAENEDADTNATAVLREKLLIPKVRTFSMLDAASTSQLGRYLEDEEALHPPLEPVGSSSSLHTSLLSSNGSAVPRPPHSKNLVLDPESNGSVLQAAVSSGAEVVEVVAEQSWLITKLAVQLIWALRMSKRWILCALRLISFVFLLLPPIVKVAIYWFFAENVHKNIIYGLNRRNLLDVYTVPQVKKKEGDDVASPPTKSRSSSVASTGSASFTEARYPVVVFVSGGAWIIGYKAWGALMGRVLASLGVVVVMPDYRNFPQGVVPDMVEDVTRAMQWVFDNIHLFGGDRENVHLIGQSAGAHLAMCTLLEQVEKKRSASVNSAASPSSSVGGMGNTSDCESIESLSPLAQPITWNLRQIRSYIGISGPYNMEASIATFHRHGFDRAVVERIMAHRLAYYSPSLRLLALSELPSRTRHALLQDFPPCFLFHGTADKTVSYRSSEQLTAALQSCSIPVSTRFFEGKTHTDPIIEDPIVGDDFLLDDVMAALKAQAPVDPITGKPRYELGARPQEKRFYPKLLVRVARKINPF